MRRFKDLPGFETWQVFETVSKCIRLTVYTILPVAPMPALSAKVHTPFWADHPNPHVRLLGRDAPARLVLNGAAQAADAPFRLPPAGPSQVATDDYAQIDPSLPMDRDDSATPDPLPHTSYAGLTPVQRRRFANWLAAPEVAGPVAFRRLYLAWLECELLERDRRRQATAEISSLLAAPGWAGESGLPLAALLAGWLAQNGEPVAAAICHGGLDPALLGIAAGWLAALGHPLDGACALALARGWQIHAHALSHFDPERDGGLLQLRITSQASTLGADPLAWALEAGGAAGAPFPGEWLPWRCVHRELRLLLPQMNVRTWLEPRLADIFASLPVPGEQPPADAPPRPEEQAREEAGKEWKLILEFGNSRSQHYDYVTHLARKQPGYQLLMDETRQLIHRIHFRKRHMRQFWRLWNYVESWSSTRVYVNGEEIQKWNVFPYSAEMR